MMNRSEFMFRLAQLLADLSQAERSEALQYYQDYFDEAGPENEQQIIMELGSPEAVAASIKAGLSSEDSEKGEFSERGFTGYGQPDFDAPGQFRSRRAKFEQMKDEAGKKFNEFSGKFGGYQDDGYHQRYEETAYGHTPYEHRERRRFSGGQIALIVILIIFASPIILAVAGMAIGIVAAIFGSIIAIVVSLFGTTAALLAGGLAQFIYGASQCFSSPVDGIMTCGISLLSMAAGALLVLVDLWVITKACPAMWHWLVRLWHRIFGRRRERV